MGPIEQLMNEDHARLEALLDASVADPYHFDHDAFEQFRAGLLRHIAVEEKVLLTDAKRRRAGEPLPVARALRVEHGALASLLVPTPNHAIVAELRTVLAVHNPREEGPEGMYAQCEALAGAEVELLLEKAKRVPPVPPAAHFDGQGVYRRAEDALRASAGSVEKMAARRAATPGAQP